MRVVRSMPRSEVGDVSVSWVEVTAPSDGVSILAQQRDSKLVPLLRGDEGLYIHSLLPGRLTAEYMISELVGRSRMATRSLRLFGWVGTFVGSRLVLSCVPALLGLVPFGVGRALEPLARVASSVAALGAPLGLSATVVSIAWVGKRSDTNGLDGVVVNHGAQRWRWEEDTDVCIAVREEL